MTKVENNQKPFKRLFKYFVSSIIYFIFLLFLFFSLPNNGSTRSQGFGFFFIFLSYVWIPIGLVIGVISGLIAALICKNLSAKKRVLILVANIILPMVVAILFVAFTETKTELVDNPSCVNKIASLKPYVSLNNVQTKELDRDKNNELDTVRVDFDVLYSGEKTLSSFGYVELNSPEKDKQLIMYQWDGLPDEKYPNSFPRIILNKGITHVVRYIDIHEYTPIEILPKLKEQTLSIRLKHDIDQSGNCTCIACNQDVFIFGDYSQTTHFDLTKFKPDPFSLEEYSRFKNRDSF